MRRRCCFCMMARRRMKLIRWTRRVGSSTRPKYASRLSILHMRLRIYMPSTSYPRPSRPNTPGTRTRAISRVSPRSSGTSRRTTPSPWAGIDGRIWKEVRGEEDMAGYIDSASRSHSSHNNHPPPILFKLDPFSTMNEVAVVDEKEEKKPLQSFDGEEDDWSDVSV